MLDSPAKLREIKNLNNPSKRRAVKPLAVLATNFAFYSDQISLFGAYFGPKRSTPRVGHPPKGWYFFGNG